MGRPGLATAEELALLERGAALEALADALAGVAAHRRGRVLFVSGEAGAGKTVLLRAFCQQAPRETDLHWATCDALVTPRPLGPLLDLADDLGDELRQQITDGAPPHDVAASLLRASRGRLPSVVVIEDVHWADEATLDVLRLVAGRVSTVPLMLVVSYRSDQVERVGPLRLLLGELPARESVAHLEVPPLSADAVAVLAEPTGTDPAALFARTGGNPFFVTEALAAADAALPASIRDAVLARSARLSESARSLLDAVAVVPGRTEVWLLDALGAVPAGAVDECLSAGMLRQPLAPRSPFATSWRDSRWKSHCRPTGAWSSTVERSWRSTGSMSSRASPIMRREPAMPKRCCASPSRRRRKRRRVARTARRPSSMRVLCDSRAAAPDERADLLERYAAECYLTVCALRASSRSPRPSSFIGGREYLGASRRRSFCVPVHSAAPVVAPRPGRMSSRRRRSSTRSEMSVTSRRSIASRPRWRCSTTD